MKEMPDHIEKSYLDLQDILKKYPKESEDRELVAPQIHPISGLWTTPYVRFIPRPQKKTRGK